MNKQKKSVTEKDVKRMQKEIEQLAFDIDKVEDEKLVIQNMLKKALSDYANLEKEGEKRVEIRIAQSKIEVAKKLMPVMDDMALAMKAAEGLELKDNVQAWFDGLKGIFSNIEQSLIGIGVESIAANAGEKFNSEIHEALGVVACGEVDTIHEVIQPGYRLGEFIVRPVRVLVAKGK